MSDPNDLKPPETDTESRSPSPKPVGMSIKERMAMFNKQAESSNAPSAKQPPPSIGRKPLNWQPPAERKVSSGEGRSGLSANDAASSISRPGGSLKDRMAALQGAFGSASAPSPGPKPEVKPKETKQADDIKSPIEESDQQDRSESVNVRSTDDPDVAKGAASDVVKDHSDEPEANGDEDAKNAEEDRVKRQDIAARMARLGGMRLGGPPMPSSNSKTPEPETSAVLPEEAQTSHKTSEELQEEQKQEPKQNIPAPVDTTNMQEESTVEAKSEAVPEAKPEEPVQSVQEEPLPEPEQTFNDVKEPIEELNDQPTSMKAPPLARRAKPPRRRLPQTQVQTDDLDAATTTPLPETPAIEQVSQEEKVEKEEVSQEASSREPDQALKPVTDDENPSGDHLHRFSPPSSQEEVQTDEQSTEDRRISIATAFVDKPTPLNEAIEHFHSPLDKEETPVETPKDEIEPSSPLPIAQPSLLVTEVQKDEEAPPKMPEEAGAPQNYATLDDDIESSEPRNDDEKGKERRTYSESDSLDVDVANEKTEQANEPQNIENSLEHRLEKESRKAAEKEEQEADAVGNDDVLQTSDENESDEPPIPSGKPIVEKEKQEIDENVQEPVTLADESSPEVVNETASVAAPSVGEEQDQAPIEEATSSNAKGGIAERMAKISMAGGFKFGPAPPVLNKPVQHSEDWEAKEDKEDNKEEEIAEAAPPVTEVEDEKMSISEKPVEQVDETKEGITQPDDSKIKGAQETQETQKSEETEETDAERRARIAKKLAASGTLRPVFGGTPEQVSPAPQEKKKNDFDDFDDFDEEASNSEASDDDDMKRFMEGVQKKPNSDERSDGENFKFSLQHLIPSTVGDSAVSSVQGDGLESKVSQSHPEPSDPEEDKKSIPLPSRNMPSLTTELSESSEATMHPDANGLAEQIHPNTVAEPESEAEMSPPPIPSRQIVASPPTPVRSVPSLPQSPPERTMPIASPISTDFEAGKRKSVENSPSLASPPARTLPVAPPINTNTEIGEPKSVENSPSLASPPARTLPVAPPINTNTEIGEPKSVENSPSLASPPARTLPAPPSAASASSPRPPIPRRRPSLSSQKSINRSSLGSVMDQGQSNRPRTSSVSSSVDQPNLRSSLTSTKDAPSLPGSPQVMEPAMQEDLNEDNDLAERRRNITERLAASGGIRPLVGGLPQQQSRSVPQHQEEASEPNEELSKGLKGDADEEETPESEAERRARIAKKLAMQGTIRPIFGGMESQEPTQSQTEPVVEDVEQPKLEVEEQHLETPRSADQPPPVPRQRPRSFLGRPSSTISPPKTPPPTSPPPDPPIAPPRQLPKLEPPTSQQSTRHGEEDIDDEKHKSSGEFVRVPSQNLSVTTPKTERDSFEFVTPPKDRDIPSPRSGKSPTGPRPAGKHIYTHDELVQLSQSLGRKINEFTKAQYELSKNMPIADGTSIGFVTETLAFCNAASDPENWNFGHLIHSQNAQGIVKRLDDPRVGDILVLKHSEFKGRKAFGNYKSHFGANGPQVAFVAEYELKKGKVSAMQSTSQPNHYPTLEYISIKFGDLKDGSFDIFRPVPLS
ncbi:hypothetical protein E3P96_02992 [Wallemia ichthyophaga]|nr:hypothetical protein E3P96_02992 [Wallemia ichthyophaga]